jgi:hypothetical protein
MAQSQNAWAPSRLSLSCSWSVPFSEKSRLDDHLCADFAEVRRNTMMDRPKPLPQGIRLHPLIHRQACRTIATNGFRFLWVSHNDFVVLRMREINPHRCR